MSGLEATAQYQAARAVIARALGVEVVAVEIFDDGTGRCTTTPAPASATPEALRNIVAQNADSVAAVAGELVKRRRLTGVDIVRLLHEEELGEAA